MPKHIILTVLLSMVILASCEQAPSINPSPTPTSGIVGMVTEGPMCPGPVPVGNNPCPDQPFQATISVLNIENTQIAQTQSDAQGHFEIALAPGTYILHPISKNIFPHAADQTVVVDPGLFTKVTIFFDTGMR